MNTVHQHSHDGKLPSPLAELKLASDWHRVGSGLLVRFTSRGDQLEAQWSPRVPTRRECKRIAIRYRAARDLFLAALAQQTGLRVAVVELQP